MLDVVGIDHNGDLLLVYPDQPELRIMLPVEHLDGTAPGVGDRLLARLVPAGEDAFEARPLRVLPRQPREVTGIVEDGAGGWVRVVRFHGTPVEGTNKVLVLEVLLQSAEKSNLAITTPEIDF